MWRAIQPEGQAEASPAEPQCGEEVQVSLQGAHELQQGVPPAGQAKAPHYDPRQHEAVQVWAVWAGLHEEGTSQDPCQQVAHKYAAQAAAQNPC